MLVHIQQQAWDKASCCVILQNLAIYTLLFHSEVFLLRSISVPVPFLFLLIPENFLLHSLEKIRSSLSVYLARNQLNSEIFLLYVIKTQDYVFLTRPLPFKMAHILSTKSFLLNKYSSLCLSLNSFFL